MRTIKLANGSVLPVFRCGAAGGHLYIGVIGDTLLNLVSIFSDPIKTGTIISSVENNPQLDVVYEGYTALTYVLLQEEGILLGLQRQ